MVEQNASNAGLAGITAGETEICTVGIGVGLNYRGYGIDDLANDASFEEVAHLLIHGHLPTETELRDYQQRLIHYRGLPDALKVVLEQIPKDTHPMDVLRTACSMLGTLEPETDKHEQRAIADRLMASSASMLLDWYHFHQNGKHCDG